MAGRGQTSAREPGARAARVWLSLIIILYLSLGTLYALRTPLWQAPDEPAHYNYVRHILEYGRRPVFAEGDYPVAYLEELKAARFPPDMSIEPLRYEAHQPPLYYLLAAGWARLTDVFGLALPFRLRLFSVLLTAVTLAIAYQVVRGLGAGHDVALGAVALAATLPMHVAMSAAINNDPLSHLLTNIAALLVVRRTGDGSARRAVGLGAALGLALLTKMQAYVAVALALTGLLWDGTHAVASRSWRKTLGLAALMLGIAGLLALPWLADNVAQYGWRDPLALARHDQIVTGQLTTAQFVRERGWLALATALARTTFQSFWGQFGWMGVPMHPRVYLALALLSAAAACGLLVWVWPRRARIARERGRALALILVWVGVTTAGFLWWNTRYLQHQGRYFLPALTPIGLGFTLGLRELLRGPGRSLWIAWGLLLLAVLGAGLALGAVPRFTLALCLTLGPILWVARWVERRRPGLAL
ncbi:MAG: glycosyltransferase family 39 protein, partial [Anaerolineae bacterium]|nr:glycosyltransferase family 39 protein [Anaerolineae bacterium]